MNSPELSEKLKNSLQKEVDITGNHNLFQSSNFNK
jgi:hypothetical protein